MKYLVQMMILSTCQIIHGILKWTVVEKVTDYGQNVTLFCNVLHCCPKDAGWDSWTPVQRTLFIDVKTGRSNKKYDGKIFKDGYSLIIQNLTEQDLNVSYSCLYGVTLGERKFLLKEDVFRDNIAIQPKISTGNNRFSGGEIAGIILGVLFPVAVTVVFVIIYLFNKRKIRHRNIHKKITKHAEGADEDERRSLMGATMICNETQLVPGALMEEQTTDHVQNEFNDFKETVLETVKEQVIENVKEAVEDLDTTIQEKVTSQVFKSGMRIGSTVENNIENTRKVIISQCDSNFSFVETRAVREILRILNKKHYVIIKGNPGDGKTTLAYFAMHRLINEQNKKPLQLFSYLEWNKYVSPDENLAIFIDNLFGEHSVSYDNVTHWSHRFPMIKATVSDGQHSNYVIICIRNDIFNQCQEMVYNEFLNSAMVDISHGNEFALNLDEMKSIFCKYIPNNKLLLSKAKLSNLLQNVPTLGFPQCCYLYKDIEKLQEKGLDFFKSPLYFLEKELNARFHAKDMKMAVLVCVLLFGGNVNKSILYDKNQNRKLKESAMTMCSVESIDFTIFQDSISNIETSFIVHDVNDDMLKFAHSSVQKAVFLVVGKHNPDDLIQNCDYTLLSLISTPQCPVKSSESIVISEKSSRILMNRILELLTSRSSTVFKVISELNVWNDKLFFKKCLDFDGSFVEAVDDDECSLFVHFSAAGCIKWVEHLYNILVNKKQLIKALEVACGSNKQKIVIFLLGKNVEPNIRCCFNAARGGYLNILNALVDANSDLCRELDKTQSYWKTESYSLSVLEEAALFNQCHLIEPLFKLCPYLITVRSSCNTTFIHTMAMAGNVELLKRYIESKTFSPYDKSGFDSTILHFACQSNRFETVKYIIETYPDLLLPEHYCFTNGTVLHTAAQSGNIIMFQYVHQKNIDILENKHIKSIPLYDDNYVYDSNSGEYQTSVEISKLLHVRDCRNVTVLHEAALSGSIELFEYVAKKSIDFLGERLIYEISSILKYAKSRNNNEDMVSYLKETYDGVQSNELSESDSSSD